MLFLLSRNLFKKDASYICNVLLECYEKKIWKNCYEKEGLLVLNKEVLFVFIKSDNS